MAVLPDPLEIVTSNPEVEVADIAIEVPVKVLSGAVEGIVNVNT